MNRLKLLIIIGILFFSASAFGIEVCEWSTAANATKAGAQITALTYSNNVVYAGTTGYDSKMFILNAPNYNTSIMLVPMSAIYDLKNISDGTPIMVGNQGKVFQFAGNQWNEICQQTFTGINNQYFNKIVSGTNPMFLGGVGNTGLANVISLLEYDCDSFTMAGPANATSLQSLVRDSYGKIWALTANSNRVYKYNDAIPSWDQITENGTASGTKNMIFAGSTGRIYLAKKIGTDIKFYYRVANTPINSVWTAIGTISNSNKVTDMFENSGIIYALAEMSNGTVSLYKLDNATGSWPIVKNFSDITNANRLLVRNTNSFFVSGFNANGAKILKYGCYTDNPPTAGAGDDGTTTVGSTVALHGTASDDKPNPAIKWTQTTGPAVAISNDTTLTPMITFATVGSYKFKITVTDSQSQTAFDEVIMTVNAPVDNPPVAIIKTTPDVTTNNIYEGDTIYFESISTDDKGIKKYVFSSGVIEFATNQAFTWTVPSKGAYSFKLTVTDTIDQTNETIMIINALEPTNQAPTAIITTDSELGQDIDSNIEVNPTGTVTIKCTSSIDPEEDSYTCLWSQISGPAKTIPQIPANSFNLTLSANDGGNIYDFKVLVTDGSGATAIDTIKIRLKAAPFAISTDSSCYWKYKYFFGEKILPKAIEKTSDGTLYVLAYLSDESKGVVYKSTNNGSTWDIVASKFGVPYDTGHLLIDSEDNIFVAGYNDTHIIRLNAAKDGWITITGNLLNGKQIRGIVETSDQQIVVSTGDNAHKLNKTTNQIEGEVVYDASCLIMGLSSSPDKKTIYASGYCKLGALVFYNKEGLQNWPYPIVIWPNNDNPKVIQTMYSAAVSTAEISDNVLLTLAQNGEIFKYNNNAWSAIGTVPTLTTYVILGKLKKIDNDIFSISSNGTESKIVKTTDGTTWKQYSYAELESHNSSAIQDIVKGGDNKTHLLTAGNNGNGNLFYLSCGEEIPPCNLTCTGNKTLNAQLCSCQCNLTCGPNQSLNQETCTCTDNAPNNNSQGSPGPNPTPYNPPPQKVEDLVFNKTLSSENLKNADIESLLEIADKNSEQEAAFGLSDKIEVTKEIKTYAKGNDANTIVKITVKNNDKVKYKDLKIIDVIPKEILDTAVGKITTSATYNILVEDPVLEFGISELAKGASKTIEYSFKKDLSKLSASDVNKWEASFAYAGEESIDLCKNVKCNINACKTSECVATTGKCKYTNKEDGANCGTNKKCSKGKCIAAKADINANVDMNFIDANIGSIFELPKLPYMEIGIAIILLILAVAGFWFVKNKEKQEENNENAGQTEEEFKF
ncbi:MAG: hypothetical protein AABW72_04030 [archaeon]